MSTLSSENRCTQKNLSVKFLCLEFSTEKKLQDCFVFILFLEQFPMSLLDKPPNDEYREPDPIEPIHRQHCILQILLSTYAMQYSDLGSVCFFGDIKRRANKVDPKNNICTSAN